uniref:ABC transporter domain-containing protein n=1 Tax=Ditylenchus dipsaci TaxID=166011 RepID=A0A915EME6_9BILA
MEENLREKLLDNDQIAVDMEAADLEMDSVRTSVSFVHPTTSKISKALSMNSVLPAMELSWHAITVKPKKKPKSPTPLVSTLQRVLSDSEDFEFQSPSSGKRDFILENVFGVAHPGEVLALMELAGKTSLLNILTQRNLNTVKSSGCIRLNGYDIDKSTLRKISAYVQQDDLFIGTMTVVEHLRFMALLRMGKYYSEHEREKRVQSVMSELGLHRVANTIIGWPHRLKGISGGERKRLAFASEIMTGPPVLFCDEPTSGLDAYLAQQVVQVLKELARRKHMTVVITIHQPSSQIFEMFDKICLLAEGKVAFLGKTEEAIQLWDYLGYPLPENFNPGDHFISTLAVEAGKGRKARGRINKICDAYLQSEPGKKTLALSKGEDSLASSSSSGSSAIWQGDDSFSQVFSQLQSNMAATAGCSHETLFSGDHARTHATQSPILPNSRVIYFNTPVRQTTVMNINGLLFQSIANMNFMFQFAAVNTFCEELPIFMREHLAHLYRVDTFFIAKNLAELVQYVLYPIVFATIVYWMSGFVRDVTAYALFTVSCVLITNVAVSIAYAAACIFGTTDVATAVMPIFVIPLLAFGGFYINQESLPFYFYPVKYLSYFGYAFETTAINQWTRVGNISGCEGQLSGQVYNNGTTCYHTGAEVLESLSFRPSNLVFDYMAMLVMAVVLRLIAFVALVIRASTKK